MPDPVKQQRKTDTETEIAFIDAATKLTLGAHSKMPADMAKNYTTFYHALVKAFHETVYGD